MYRVLSRKKEILNREYEAVKPADLVERAKSGELNLFSSLVENYTLSEDFSDRVTIADSFIKNVRFPIHLGIYSFSGSHFKSCRFDGHITFSDICDSILQNTKVSCESIDGSIFNEIDSLDCDFSNNKFKKVEISKSYFFDSNFSDCVFQEVEIIDSELSGCCFDGVEFKDVVFSESKMTRASFKGCSFENVIFKNVSLEGAMVDDDFLKGLNL